MVLNNIHGSLKVLIWESKFFGISSAILQMYDDAPIIREDDLQLWQRVQAKIPTNRTDWLNILQNIGFLLVSGEIDLAIMIRCHYIDRADITIGKMSADIATEEDILELRAIAAQQTFTESRFREPWYPAKDRDRFYAQWIENAVKGTFDHQCLVFRNKENSIKSFVSLRQLNDHEARIGLMYGRGMGKALMQSAIHWAQTRHLSILRMSTQMSNITALRFYIASGANIENTNYWLYYK